MRSVVLFLATITLTLNSVLAFDRYTAHGGPIKGLAYSANLGLLVSTSFDYTAVVWDTAEMVELKQLVGHNAAVNTAAFSPDGQWLATAGDDNQILLWAIDELKKPNTTPEPFALHGHTAKVGTDGHIRLWNLETGEYIRSVVKNGFGVNVMEISPELNLLAFGGSNGVMKTISLDNTGPGSDLWVGGPPVLAISIDSASQKMAFGTAEGRIVIADAAVGEIQHDFNAVKGPVWAMALGEGSETLFFAGLDDWVTKISLNDFIVPHPLAERDRRFHPDQPIDNGQKQFARKCSVCHSLTPSSKRRAGPTLYGVFGRKVGAVDDYPYSKELLEMDLVWNEETIDLLFRDGPDVVTPGSKMPVQRIKGAEDRADLISYLKRATAPQ
jgi:cytochrome c